MTDTDSLVDALEMDSERFAKSARVMEMEEEWLKEVASSMMDYKEPICVSEPPR
jgi:hypothetical protein